MGYSINFNDEPFRRAPEVGYPTAENRLAMKSKAQAFRAKPFPEFSFACSGVTAHFLRPLPDFRADISAKILTGM
jgi:hypothetical protein